MSLSSKVNDAMFLELERKPIDQVLDDWENAREATENLDISHKDSKNSSEIDNKIKNKHAV